MKNIIGTVIILVVFFVFTNAAPRIKRVVGGEQAEDGQFPFIVSVQIFGNHTCGGSILNEYWILTAAHCVNFVGKGPSIAKIFEITISLEDVTVMVGSNTLSPPGKIYKIEHAIVHPKFDPKLLNHDIALLKIKHKLHFNKKVHKIRLETEKLNDIESFTLAGWGGLNNVITYPNELYFIELKSVTLETCKKMYKEIWAADDINDIGENDICAYISYGEGSCHGDSGGPLVYHKNGTVRVAGIVSYGEPCARGYPDVYTKVYSYVHWIHKQMHKNMKN